MNNYLVTVPDFTTVVESTNFIAFDAPVQAREIRRYDKEQAVKAAHREGWDLAMKIWDMTWTERREAFGDNLYSLEDVVACDLDFLAEKYAAWKKKKAEEAAARKIEVGEIWQSKHVKLVVLNVTDSVVRVMCQDGRRIGLSRHTFCDIYTYTGKKIDLNAIKFLNEED